MAETIKKIIEVEVQTDQARQKTAALTATLADLRMEQKELAKSLNVAVDAFGKQSDQAKRAGDALAQNRRKVAEVSGEIRNFNKELDTNSNSLRAAELRLAALRNQFANLDQSLPGSAKKMADLRREIDLANQSVSKQRGLLGQFQGNVGNYAGGIKSALAGSLGQVGQLATAGGAVGVAVAATVALGAALKQTTQDAAAFEKQISILSGATGLPKTSKEMEALSAQALQLGKDTVFTAEQVAQAQTELAKAGLTSAQILATTGETLNLATAGQLELAAAATLTADTLNQFQLPADNAGRVVDALAFAANKSSTSVDLMGQSMKYIAPISSALGVSIEETAALIGTLANQGFKGEQATASFATSLTRLASPSKEAAKLMAETGTQIFDNTGKFVGYEKAVAEFARVTKDMTQEQQLAYLSTVAGADATKQWTALIGAGSEKLGAFARDINAVTDGNGKFTESLAKTNLDNYAGAVEQFDGAVNSLSISIGKLLIPALTTVAKWGTAIIDIFSGDRSFKTAFADATAGFIKLATAGQWSSLSDAIYNWGHAEEAVAKAIAQTNKEMAVRQQKQAEAQRSTAEMQKQTLARMRMQLKAVIAANEEEVKVVQTTQAELSAAQKKANEARILQLQQEEYELMQLNGLMQDSLRLEMERASLFDEMKSATVGGDALPVAAQNAADKDPTGKDVPESLLAEYEAQIAREEYQTQFQKEQFDKRLAQAAEYAQAAGQIASGLSNLYSALEAKQLAEAGDNEAKKLEIQKKFAKRQAAIQIVQAIIDGFVGAQKTYSTLGLPAATPFLIAGGIGTALNVAAIATNASRFAEGGLVGGGVFDGPRHSGGGVKFAAGGRLMEAEGGEAILTRRATSMFRPMLSAMNQAGGGRKFEAGGTIGASASVMAGDPFAAAMRSAMANLPVPVVAVSEINAVQNRVAVKEAGATL